MKKIVLALLVLAMVLTPVLAGALGDPDSPLGMIDKIDENYSGELQTYSGYLNNNAGMSLSDAWLAGQSATYQILFDTDDHTEYGAMYGKVGAVYFLCPIDKFLDESNDDYSELYEVLCSVIDENLLSEAEQDVFEEATSLSKMRSSLNALIDAHKKDSSLDTFFCVQNPTIWHTEICLYTDSDNYFIFYVYRD